MSLCSHARAVLAVLLLLTVTVPARADTMIVNGQARTYVEVAPNTTARAPLVIVLHGNGGNGQQIAAYTGWDTLARSERFAAVFPDAIAGAWEIGPSAFTPAGNNDTAFINKLVATLVANGIADPRRVYLTGLSRGGAMTYDMVCVKAQLFAAAAPVITSAQVGFEKVCRPYRPMPMLLINGTADALIPYNGGAGTGPTAGYNLMPIPSFLKLWRTTNGCAPEDAAVSALPNLDTADKSTVTLITSTCPANRDVVLYRVNGGGHQQPARPASPGSAQVERLLGPQNHDFDGTKTIWAFFKRFAL